MAARKLAILGFAVLVTLGPAMLAAQNTVSYSVVTEQRLLNPEPHNWLMYRGNFSGWGYSPLEQITPANVKKLAPLMGAAATILSVALAAPFMGALGAGPDVLPLSVAFLHITALTFAPAALLFIGTAALRGMGDTRTPLYVMLGVNAVNIALSWLLVNGNAPEPAQAIALGVLNGATRGAVFSPQGTVSSATTSTVVLRCNHEQAAPATTYGPDFGASRIVATRVDSLDVAAG